MNIQTNPIQRVPVEVYHSSNFDHHGSILLMEEGYRVRVEYLNPAFDEEIYLDQGMVCSRDWVDGV
jgi:hypothetical protein